MTIADIYFVHQRGLKNAIYVWAEQVGGYLAIVAAGFLTSSQGWRGVWCWCTIFLGVQFIAFFFAFEESNFTHVRSLEARQGSVRTVQDISGHVPGDYKDTKGVETPMRLQGYQDSYDRPGLRAMSWRFPQSHRPHQSRHSKEDLPAKAVFEYNVPRHMA